MLDQSTFIIYDNFEIVNLNSVDACLHRDISYFIHTSFHSLSTSRLHKYYSHKVFDNNFNKIENNTLAFYGIECLINENEYWLPFFRNSHAVAIKVNITDRRKNAKMINFQNDNVNRNGIQNICKYIRALSAKNVHEEAIDDINRIIGR